MHRPAWLQALRMGCGLGVVLLVGAFPATLLAADASRREALRFAVRRAALELGAARPEAAARALSAVHPEASTRDEQEAVLLWAETEWLAGNATDAKSLFENLTTSGSGFVRAQAAAHLMAAAAETGDSTGVECARRFLREAGGYSSAQRRDAGAGFLLAAALLQRGGDGVGASRALAAAPGTAQPVAQLLLAEQALEHGETKAAETLYRAAQRQSESGGDSLTAWIAAAAQLGRARAWALAGDPARANDGLQPLPQVEPLRQYGQLLAAEIAYASGDVDAASQALRGIELQQHDPVQASEAGLLAVQVEIDRARYATAESLAAALGRALPQWLDPERAACLPAELRLDLHAWHWLRTRATLDAASERDVLRQALRGTRLDAAPVLRFDTPIAADTTSAACTLLQPYRHAPAIDPEQGYRQMAMQLGVALLDLRHREVSWREAEAGLAVRRLLLERAAREMTAHEAALAALQRASLALDAALADYRQALAAQDADWLRLFQSRLAALRAAVTTIERGSVRLEARYPADRSVRSHEETARARRAMLEAEKWIASVDSLERDVSARVDAQVHAVLLRQAPDAAAAELAALRQRLAALLESTLALRRALEGADAAERAALAAATERWRAADGAARVARARTDAARLAYVDEAAHILAARRAAYLESANEAEATAAFLAAVADTSGGLAVRQERAAHGATLLGRFVQQFPHARRHDEALYRLAELHVRRAALAHQQALAAAGETSAAAAIALPMDLYADALDTYSRLLSEHPESPRIADTHFQMGFLFAEMGSPEASSTHLQEFLQRAAADEPRRGRAGLRLGENLVFLGRIDAAMAAYELAAAGVEEETRALGRLKLAWCAFELDRLDVARAALHDLLAEAAAGGKTCAGLQPEALESLALCFAADHRGPEAAQVLDTWGRPPYDFALLRRMAALFAARAQYDEAIETDRALFERHPLHPHAPAVVLEEIHLVEIRQGEAAAHDLAATRAPLFAPGGAWATAKRDTLAEVEPAWQSRLIEEDLERARADSVARALAVPQVAAARMARELRRAAVFAHQQGQRATPESATQLQRAATLYRQTLALFPGADDEPKTWVFLGEALFALGQHVEAADAYARAAAHAAADSTTRVEAARLELAALDHAVAADPRQLDRFAATTSRFVERTPQDVHGHDALERVGELAFAAGRYEQAETAYATLARHTPEPRRAVSAQKSVGDTWWRRENYLRAAAHYDTALAAARASGVDSLAQVLTVLAPSALFRAAEAEEKREHRVEAAQVFERLVDQHADFASNDQVLYRAARLRAASGDTTRALAHYARLVDAYPESSLQPDALLELAALHAARGERALAASTYVRFADRHATHPQAGASRLRAAELYAADGNPAAAETAYATLEAQERAAAHPDTALVAQIALRRGRLVTEPEQALPHYARALAWGAQLAPTERGEAAFQVAEAQRRRYESLGLDPPLAASLQVKKKALEEALAAYAVVLENTIEPWHAAACLRVGECLTHLGGALAASPAPAELAATDVEAYRLALGSQADALEVRAVGVWSEGLRGARGAASTDAWTRSLESRLHPVLARRVPLQPEPLFVVVQP